MLLSFDINMTITCNVLILKAGDTSSSSVVTEINAAKPATSEESIKERPSRKNKKKEKEQVEKANVDKTSIKSKREKRLLALPVEASVLALLLLVFLGAFYVVLYLFLLPLLLYFSSVPSFSKFNFLLVNQNILFISYNNSIPLC